jgi:predicted DNA-binding transcriptional regulator YafY
MLAIVLELQRKPMLRAEDLAAVFEVSVRTIYRDIQALSEAGVPIAGAPGQGYSLMEGYFLPPVSFTVDEAVTLLIGTDFIEQKFDEEYRRRADSSRNKIEAILPESVRLEAARVRSMFRLLAIGKEAVQARERIYLETIRKAIAEERKIQFAYTKSMADEDGNRHSFRTAAPYGLVLTQGVWLLVAHCDLREDIRHFRLSRMSELTVLPDRYDLPPDFRMTNYKPRDDRELSVRIRVNPEIVDRVKEAGNFFMVSLEPEAEGETGGSWLATFRVRRLEELLYWVLGWGAGMQVLEPESFREQVRDEVIKMLKRC